MPAKLRRLVLRDWSLSVARLASKSKRAFCKLLSTSLTIISTFISNVKKCKNLKIYSEVGNWFSRNQAIDFSEKNYTKPEAYSEPCQTSQTELLPKIVKSRKPYTISPQSSILDIWQSSECAYAKLTPYKHTTCIAR